MLIIQFRPEAALLLGVYNACSRLRPLMRS